ncbi:MAG: D-alanyl-D-alanine carboxypeptidase family protein [Oscillospiraceae bacterium]
MKKTLAGILTLILFISPILICPARAEPGTSAQAEILIHADTGQVLCQKNADAKMLIASTTKIMTALVVIENCSPEEKIKILPEYAAVEGSSMYLKAGETYTVRDLLYGMLLASGNDAAAALAYHCGGTIAGFAEMMNAKVEELGLHGTAFKNPHGLDAEGHYSTAADLAAITRSAMENELFAKIVSTKTYTVGEQSYMNHNKLLWNYEGAIGVKTGYTIAAGRSLVSCAERNGLRLICVTLSDPNDWCDHKALYDWGFSTYEYRQTLPSGIICEIPVISGEKDSVGITCTAPTRTLVKKGSKQDFSLELPEFVYAGVRAGEAAGRAIVTVDGVQTGEYPLIYTEDVALAENAKLSPWARLKRVWFLSNKYGITFNQSKS